MDLIKKFYGSADESEVNSDDEDFAGFDLSNGAQHERFECRRGNFEASSLRMPANSYLPETGNSDSQFDPDGSFFGVGDDAVESFGKSSAKRGTRYQLD